LARMHFANASPDLRLLDEAVPAMLVAVAARVAVNAGVRPVAAPGELPPHAASSMPVTSVAIVSTEMRCVRPGRLGGRLLAIGFLLCGPEGGNRFYAADGFLPVSLSRPG